MSDIIYLSFSCLTSFTWYDNLYVAENSITSFFMTKQYSIVYMHHIFFIHSSVDGHLGCFHVLAVVNSAAVSIWGTYILSDYGFLQIYAQEWDCQIIQQLCLNFLRNLHTVLHSGCINLHCHQKCRSAPFLHTFSCIYCLCDFWMMAILTGVRSYLVVLILISLIISDVEHLFLCFWPFVYLLWRNVC